MAGLSCEGLTHTSAEWFERANCRGKGPDIFFPERGYSPYEALELCHGCEVSKECLEYAVKNGISHGLWGGKSPRSRRANPRPVSERYMSQTARNRIVWLDRHGWTDEEIGCEFGITSRTVSRVLQRERRR